MKKPKNIFEIQAIINNDEMAWEKIQELRANFSPVLMEKVRVGSKQEALSRGLEIIQKIFEKLQAMGIDLMDIEPGAGFGHFTRDYLNAIVLANKLDTSPQDLFIGLVSGALHEMGVTIRDRYAENKQAIRHAEAGAILLYEIMSDDMYFLTKLNRAERILICYAIAAHTHYLKEMDIACEDGITRKIKPYRDTYYDNTPIIGIWFARWTDRLDIDAPAFVARHYLTLEKSHIDYSQNGFFSVTFADHMRPLLRSSSEISAQGGNRTLLEHLNMFATSQNNDSPYGKYDFGAMIEMRDRQTERLNRIIQAVQESKVEFDSYQTELVLTAWTTFLYTNIEPTPKALITAIHLKDNFKKLDQTTQRAWLNGFVATMREYIDWSKWIMEMTQNLPDEWFYINNKSIDKIIMPVWHWENLLKMIK